MNRSDKRKLNSRLKKEWEHVGKIEEWFVNCLFSEEVEETYAQLFFAFNEEWIRKAKHYNKAVRKSYEPQVDELYFSRTYKPLENA